MRIFGVISDERAYRSKSPAMHNYVLRKLQIDGVYLPLAVESDLIGEAISGLRGLGLAGVNVTVPYKEMVGPYLDALSPEAAALGAVNTIVRSGRTLTGHNTDIDGLRESLTRLGFDVAGAQVLILGAGGAAKAAAWAVTQMGAGRVVIAGRDLKRAALTAALVKAEPIVLTDLLGRPVETGLVINATPASAPNESAEMTDLAAQLELRRCRLVLDLNYGRPENIWADLAKARGASFHDGLSMLAHQARLSFLLWTGIEVDVSWFEAALGVTH